MKLLEDTQNEHEQRNIAIQRVGISELHHPMTIVDRDQRRQATVARVAMAVSLAGSVRGTHMSRFVAILNEEASELSTASMDRLGKIIAQRLDSESAFMSVAFPYFVMKKAPVTGSPGMIDYQVELEVTSNPEATRTKLTVKVPVTTLCPCSRNISMRGAHNQRGLVTLSVGYQSLPWIEDLITLVEGCGSSELYSSLKRPDEKYVTEHAYDNPVFVEDLVRNVAEAVSHYPQLDWHRIQAENFESIHNHNAYAVIEKGSDSCF